MEIKNVWNYECVENIRTYTLSWDTVEQHNLQCFEKKEVREEVINTTIQKVWIVSFSVIFLTWFAIYVVRNIYYWFFNYFIFYIESIFKWNIEKFKTKKTKKFK